MNRDMAHAAQAIDGLTFVDLYAEYPRHNIDIDREQQRLLDHDVIVFQFPLFWYSTPSLLKEWQDLVLEFGFAYGPNGDRLKGKTMLLAVTTAGPQEAYAKDGYQRYPLRSFLIPLEQTAHLCGMVFLPPYVLHAALRAPREHRVSDHVAGYKNLLQSLQEGSVDSAKALTHDILTHNTLPIKKEASQ